jgi:hypothetical protein
VFTLAERQQRELRPSPLNVTSGAFYDLRMRHLGRCAVIVLMVVLSACGSSGGKAKASSPTAKSGPKSGKCPSAAVVNAALAQNVAAPTMTQQPYGVTCTYRGTGAIPTKIVFQLDTASAFAAGEAAVPTATKVTGIGDAAYTAGGFLAALKGTTALRITSPLSTSAQLEALARSILG